MSLALNAGIWGWEGLGALLESAYPVFENFPVAINETEVLCA